MTSKCNKLLITGIRGIPASHGGFESFAEAFALYATNKGWEISVYCQSSVHSSITEENWNGIRLIQIPSRSKSSISSLLFDLKCAIHACRERKIVLTLGYNTAIFNIVMRIIGLKIIMNMDGIEWKRKKWSLPARIWLFMNEIIGSKISSHLVADHPEIKNHLLKHTSKGKISVIPYSSRSSVLIDSNIIKKFNLNPNGYALVIARPEPENSILEIVKAWRLKSRNCKLVILGSYNSVVPYQKQILDMANDEVVFIGPQYNQDIVYNLRSFSRYYIHGHQVGGTNPSLVESLATSTPILAHDNKFNKWVAGQAARYFNDISECSDLIDWMNHNNLDSMKLAAKIQFNEYFTQDKVYGSYCDLIRRIADG